MINWIDLINSLKVHFERDLFLPPDTTVLVGVDSQIPKYPALRLSLRREVRLDRLMRPDIHEKRTATIYIEAWTAGGSPDGAVTLEALAEFEKKVLTALSAWAENPPRLQGVPFSAAVTEIAPGSDQSRPAVGSRITLTVDYL